MKKQNSIQMPLRIPTSLHEELKQAASLEGVSLNQYCLYLLSRYGTASKQLMKQKAENVLLFLEEAQVFQKELQRAKSGSRHAIHRS